jgi:hypothetical protein
MTQSTPNKHNNFRYIVIPLFITAVLGSYTILSVKSLSMLLRESFSGNNQFTQPLIYFVIVILVGTAVTQVRLVSSLPLCGWPSSTRKTSGACSVPPRCSVRPAIEAVMIPSRCTSLPIVSILMIIHSQYTLRTTLLHMRAHTHTHTHTSRGQ